MSVKINIENINSIENYNKLLSKNFDIIKADNNNFGKILDNKIEDNITFKGLEGGISNDIGIENEGLSQRDDNSASEVYKFANKVSSSLESSLIEVNNKQIDSENAVKTYASGGDISVHEVMIASEKASLAMQMSLQLRNKILQAYNEINQIRV